MEEGKFRTCIAGTCLVDGKHTDPELIAECPITRQAKRKHKKEVRLKRRAQAARMREAKERRKRESTGARAVPGAEQ
jgi:hypothetical protein